MDWAGQRSKILDPETSLTGYTIISVHRVLLPFKHVFCILFRLYIFLVFNLIFDVSHIQWVPVDGTHRD